MTTPILVLDAGHGLHTAGKQTMNGSLGVIKEWTINDAVCRKIQSILSDYNITVYRSDDPTGQADVPLATRVSRSNQYRATLMISIHHNSTPGATGVEVFVHTYGTEEDKKLAQLLAPKLSAKTGLRNRGVKYEKWAVLGCKATAILVEGGFMDTQSDYEVITSEKGQQAYAEAVSETVIEYLGLTKKISMSQSEQEVTTPTHSTMLIRGKEESQPIYSHADATSQVVGQLKKGETKTVFELSKDNHWGRVGENQWIGIDYVELFLAPFLYNPNEHQQKIYSQKTVFELSKDNHWGRVGENQWIGIDYVELFLAPFLYNPNEHQQKIYSHPDATSQVQGELPSNKFTPILEVSANQWGRTAKGWISLAYGGLIETSFLVKCKDNDVNAYSHPDATSQIVTTLPEGVVVTAVELSADGNWALCKSGYWIPLDFVTIL